MKVLNHHIYEYEKGLRNLILHTMPSKDREKVENILRKRNIDYHIQIVNGVKINIFFGAWNCVEIVKKFAYKNLSKFSDEEDFILGIMLGYDRLKQCERYLRRTNNGSGK